MMCTDEHLIAGAIVIGINEIIEAWLGHKKPLGAGSKIQLIFVCITLCITFFLKEKINGKGSISTEKRD